jgi:predicted nucleic acid-binding protein
VYIETSIPSFYFEERSEPAMVARREWTRQWWNEQAFEYELATSAAVLDELSHGEYPMKEDVLKLMEKIPVLAIDEAIADIVDTYLQHKLMPADPVGDALHLAVASYHKCDFLLTWNSRHLANANKFAHIRRINTMLGVFVPMLVTPLELLGGVEP